MQQTFFSIFGPQVKSGIFLGEGSSVVGQKMNQVHGVSIVEISDYGPEPEADALVSRTPGVRLVVKTADCIPLVMADEEAGVVAAVHAGWRGLTADIIPLVLEKLVAMGASPERLKVGVGPSLGTECAVFSDPFVEIPEKYHWAIHGGRVDLNGIARRQLEEAGILDENLEWLDICTACDSAWPSWRRDKMPGRFYTWVELNP